MSVRNLDRMFRPRSVAVIGASERAGSVGQVVFRNLRRADFKGPIWPVNRRHRKIEGEKAYRTVAELPDAPDLAVVCTPAATVPGVIQELGASGGRAAVVLSAGLGAEHPDGGSLKQAMLQAARPHLLRVLGPNCLGLAVPGIGLDASFAHAAAAPGRIAFISQSGAMCTAVLDWARARNIGFSHFISLGEAADVDFGDLIDFLGGEPEARSILLYIESVTQARKFLSAARAAARNKPVVAVKSGRVAAGARAAASHTGALAGNDAVYDAALRRAGILRVYSVEDLFDAVETLARGRPLAGDRLAIVTNGGGPGVMATDDLVEGGGRLAVLSDGTLAELDRLLPAHWSHGNPIDLIGDAPGERYEGAVRAVLADPGVDAVLVMHAPVATASATAAAEATIAAAETNRKNVLTCWLGGPAVVEARQRLEGAGLPTYETPGAAVRAFQHIVQHRRNTESLMQVPEPLPDSGADRTAARGIIDAALAESREWLSESEAKAVLAAYGVPIVRTQVAADAEAAVAAADAMGYPVACKILSPDVTHKSDVGGVALDLESADAVRSAAAAMAMRLERLRPQARLQGFTVQPMVRRPGAYELIAGIASDPVFGPVVLFGEGGTAVEVLQDRALALPPLNSVLADDLIARTRISRLLAGYRDRPAIDMTALKAVLVRLADLAAEVSEIEELDINPLLADEAGVLALDARIRISRRTQPAAARLAIPPYPRGLEETVRLAGGRQVLLRPIRPEDGPAHRAFIEKLDVGDIRFRFFGLVRRFEASQLARLTQIDYDREMAFIAVGRDAEGSPETLGVVRAVSDSEGDTAEFAIIVRSDLKGLGLGRVLMRKLIDYCRGRGNRRIVGEILHDNHAMRQLAKGLGFKSRSVDGATVAVELALDGTG